MGKSNARQTPQAVQETVLSVRNLKKKFGPIEALRKVDFQVHTNDIFGFLGRNGAGKSTTIKIVAGLQTPDEGEVELLGAALSRTGPAIRRRVGFLIEHPAFYPDLTAEENLYCHALLQGRVRKTVHHDVRERLADLGLEHAARRKVGGFSTGMRQRLGLAQAFLGSPDLIVLDEPLSGLDPEGIVHVREMIREWATSRDTAFFISSHILAEVEQLCTRVGILADGVTVAQGAPAELGAANPIVLKVSHAETVRDRLLNDREGCDVRLLEDGSLSLQIDEDDIPDLVREIVAAGYDLFEVTRKSRSLEELFFDLTGRSP